MSLPAPHVVVDTSAVLASVPQARGWQTVDKILPVAILPLPDLTEVLYRAPTTGHAREPGDLFARLLRLALRTQRASCRARSWTRSRSIPSLSQTASSV